jgi:hypothetical protein
MVRQFMSISLFIVLCLLVWWMSASKRGDVGSQLESARAWHLGPTDDLNG